MCLTRSLRRCPCTVAPCRCHVIFTENTGTFLVHSQWEVAFFLGCLHNKLHLTKPTCEAVCCFEVRFSFKVCITQLGPLVTGCAPILRERRAPNAV